MFFSNLNLAGKNCPAIGANWRGRESRGTKMSEEPKKKSRLLLPLSLGATAFAGFGLLLFRGCWHRKMSWPIRSSGKCYQVCTGCGIKRLFDEQAFRAYGPYNYDLNRLIAGKTESAVPQSEPAADTSKHRTAS
jgi:hypothetical protein